MVHSTSHCPRAFGLPRGWILATLHVESFSWSPTCLPSWKKLLLVQSPSGSKSLQRVILRSGDFTADHRPPSDLNTSSVIPHHLSRTCTVQRGYWGFLLDSCAPGVLQIPKVSLLSSVWGCPEKPEKHQYTENTTFHSALHFSFFLVLFPHHEILSANSEIINQYLQKCSNIQCTEDKHSHGRGRTCLWEFAECLKSPVYGEEEASRCHWSSQDQWTQSSCLSMAQEVHLREELCCHSHF